MTSSIKKVVLGVLGLILVACCCFGLLYITKSIALKNIYASSELATMYYIEMYTDSFDSNKLQKDKNLNSNIKDLLLSKYNLLKAKDLNYIDVETLYNDLYKDIDITDVLSAIPDVDMPSGTSSIETKPITEVVRSLEDDKLIELKDNRKIMYINNLVFSDSIAVIVYKNILMQINLRNIDKTYKMLIKDNAYKFKITKNMLDKSKKSIEYLINSDAGITQRLVFKYNLKGLVSLEIYD